jgi:hypothetical protein
VATSTLGLARLTGWVVLTLQAHIPGADTLLRSLWKVIYSDAAINGGSMPSVQDLKGYNRFLMAFWLTSSGAVDVSSPSVPAAVQAYIP